MLQVGTGKRSAHDHCSFERHDGGLREEGMKVLQGNVEVQGRR